MGKPEEIRRIAVKNLLDSKGMIELGRHRNAIEGVIQIDSTDQTVLAPGRDRAPF
jgi:hypothetical protein